MELAQTEDNDAPEVPLTEEENVLTEYGELFLKNTDMVGWLSIASTPLNYPVMQTPNEPNYYLKRNFEKEYSDLGTPYIQENCDLAGSDNLVIYGHHITEIKVSTSCNGCGLCASICPMKNISVKGGKAVPHSKCTMCYRCISSCPQKAITLLGNEVIEQYRIEKYL